MTASAEASPMSAGPRSLCQIVPRGLKGRDKIPKDAFSLRGKESMGNVQTRGFTPGFHIAGFQPSNSLRISEFGFRISFGLWTCLLTFDSPTPPHTTFDFAALIFTQTFLNPGSLRRFPRSGSFRSHLKSSKPREIARDNAPIDCSSRFA